MFDYDRHFRLASRGAKLAKRDPFFADFGADFGTVAGQQSVAELNDFIRIHDDLNRQLEDLHNGYSATWKANDLAAYNDWLSDWNAYRARYKAAIDGPVQGTLLSAKLSVLPDSDYPAQGAFDAVLHAVKASAPPDGGPTQKGDYGDLLVRLQNAGAQGRIVPLQPTKGLDTDLTILNDPTLKNLANAGGSTFDLLKWASTHQKTIVIGIGAFLLLGLLGNLKAALAPLRAL